MNMQGAIAALASLNHSQAAGAVANSGTAQAASNAQDSQGFGALLQMLMGTTSTTANPVNGAEAANPLLNEEQLSELGAELLQLMQLLESDPELQSAMQIGDKAELSSLLNSKGFDLESLDSQLGDLLSTDVVSLVTELMPKVDSAQLLQNLSGVAEDVSAFKELPLEARLSAADASRNNIIFESDAIEGIDPKLQELIGQKINGLKHAQALSADDSVTTANSSTANMIVDGEQSASNASLSSGMEMAQKASNAEAPLVLSPQAMQLKQKLNTKTTLSAEGAAELPKPKLAAFAESNLVKGIFSESIKQVTKNVVSKVSNMNSSLTSNIDTALGQNLGAVNQMHFDVQNQTGLSEIESAKPQFSMVSNTVDQVQSLAKDMAMQIKAGSNEIRIAIKPEHLGEMLVKVSVDSESVNLDMKVESAEVKQVFDASLNQLRESLSQNGIKVNSLNVDIQQHDMSEQSKSRFFQSFKNSKNSDKDDLDVELNVDNVVDPNIDLQSRVYAQAAYGVNYLV